MSFGDQVGAFVQKAKGAMDTEFRRSTLALYADIARGTPVDEGTLQNNWQFGVNEQNGDKLEAKKGMTEALQRARSSASGLRIRDTAIIFNNMVYAAVIENGLAGTRRIPARMVAKAIAMAQARNSK